MLFYKTKFLVIFALFYIIYRRVGLRAQNALIAIVGYILYSTWNWRFVSLLLITTCIDYWAGLLIDREENPKKRKLFLAVSMCVNLGMLGFFKYFNFFAESLIDLLHIESLHGKTFIHVILPAGISFYTFQSMSYVIDVYRRHIRAERDFLNFAAFVSYFPHLVAGPIQRAEVLLAQITQPRQVTWKKFGDGARLFMWGIYKKLVVGDNVATLVDPVFANPAGFDGLTLLMAAYAFALQIYCDFSGYTDMARGISRMIGIELTLNFNLPYFASSMRNFWQRWHISLSTWFRDYVYISLGGNRDGITRTIRNLMLSFFLSGLWHGAGWTYILWGVYHGALVSIERLLSATAIGRAAGRLPLLIRIAVCIQLAVLGWILFRAASLGDAVTYLHGLTVWDAHSATAMAYVRKFLFYLAPLAIVEIIEYRKQKTFWDYDLPVVARSALYAFFIVMIILFGVQNGRQFIYFQF